MRVLVPCYGEPRDIIYDTIVSALDQDYPKECFEAHGAFFFQGSIWPPLLKISGSFYGFSGLNCKRGPGGVRGRGEDWLQEKCFETRAGLALPHP